MSNPAPAHSLHNTDALSRAWQVQQAASEEGFDWPDVFGVLEKIREEEHEIRDALAENDVEHAQRELGDLLLAAVNAARFLGAHPGSVLNEAVDRFQLRFEGVRQRVAASGKKCRDYSLDELDQFWSEAKLEMSQSVAKALDKDGERDADSDSFHG